MDLRSMSDKEFTRYRTNFFTEVNDWTPSVISEADKLIQESNRRLAGKRLQIKKPGGLDKHLADDLLEKIATSSPLKARSRKKRRTKRTKRPRKSMRRKSKRLVGGMLRNGGEKKTKKVAFSTGPPEIASGNISADCIRCSGNHNVCQEIPLPGFAKDEYGNVLRTMDGKVRNADGEIVEDPRKCVEVTFYGVDDHGQIYERPRQCCRVVE